MNVKQILSPILLASSLLSCPAFAWEHWSRGNDHFESRREHEEDEHEWRHHEEREHRGHWRYGWHDGRLGWWWLANDLWFFNPRPVYSTPEVRTVIIEHHNYPEQDTRIAPAAPSSVYQAAPPAIQRFAE